MKDKGRQSIAGPVFRCNMESMNLTPRLACIASLVPEGAYLADIGTDHGKLPISLLRAERIAAAIASDINRGPLEHAERNAAAYGIGLSLRLAPGLDAVHEDECDTITIAGMGGQTIIEILAAAPWTADGVHLLLLQPMTMVYELRQWLWAHGYMIEKESICKEDRRQYVVLSVRGGGKAEQVPLHRCVVSTALIQAEGAKIYLEALLKRERRAMEGMQRGTLVDDAERIAQQKIVQAIADAWEGLI